MRKFPFIGPLIFTFWGLLVFTGFYALFVFANTPGEAATSISQWPAGSIVKPHAGRGNFVLFLHPQCSCSRATLGELERLMPEFAGRVDTVVFLVEPINKSEAWSDDSLKKMVEKMAEKIPGVVVRRDEDGHEAKLFSAKTSGQSFLYSPEGVLVFQGGITPSRGHMGENSGRDSILHFLEFGNTDVASAPVFGCSLINDQDSLPGKAEKI